MVNLYGTFMNEHKQNLAAARREFTRLQHKEESIRLDLKQAQDSLDKHEKTMLATERARTILQTVAANMQKTLEFHIANVVTMALASVFDDPYEFKVQFETRRNQTEVDFFFVRNGNEIDPIDNSGYGAVDVAALALRMAVWNISNSRALLMIDEPFKFLSRDLQTIASGLLKELSTQLNIQLLMVSHIPEIINEADRVFNVKLVNGVSKVTTI